MADSIPIRVLDTKPTGHIGRQPVYGFSHSYPWVMALPTAHVTKEAAFADAEQWIQQYISEAPWARMGHAIGVTVSHPSNGFRGVVNYYHSNS